MDSYFLPMVCHVDQTQAAYLENVLGFIRVLEVVLAHIGKKLPEILDWLVYMDISESFDETTIDFIFTTILHYLTTVSTKGTRWHGLSWTRRLSFKLNWVSSPGIGDQVKYFFDMFTYYTTKPRLDHGSPITRRRIFILLVRRELMLAAAKNDFEQFAKKIQKSLFIEPEVHWSLGTVISKISCNLALFDFVWKQSMFRMDLLLEKSSEIAQKDIAAKENLREKSVVKHQTIFGAIWKMAYCWAMSSTDC